MSLFLLDGVGAGFLVFLFGLGLLFLVAAVFLEAFIMLKMKYHPVYKKALLQSLLANLASLAAGYILINTDSEFFKLDSFGSFAVFFGITLLVELPVLYLLNRATPLQKTFMVCLFMNLCTYLLAGLIILLLDNL